jgi:hypothetical protein
MTNHLNMSADNKWQDGTVDVQARLVPRFLWTTASIDVFLDGQCILRTGGQFKFTGSQATTFAHSGATHTVELSWGVTFSLFSIPYQLRIDGVQVSASRVPIRNWPLGMTVAILGGVLLAIIIHLIDGLRI